MKLMKTLAGLAAVGAITSVKSALAAVDDGIQPAAWTTSSGGPLPGTAVVVSVPAGAVLAVGTNSLTGGTTPTITVT